MALFAAFIIYGWHKGFLRIFLSLAGTIIIIIAVIIISPRVSSYIIDNTDVFERTEKKVVDVFLERLYSAEEEDDTVKDEDNEGGSKEVGEKPLDELNIPDIFKNDLIEKKASEMYQALLAAVFREYIAGYISRLIINAGSFVCVYFTLWFVLKLLLRSSDLLANLPVIKTMNKTLGAAVGAVEALIMVWIVFFIIIMFLGNDIGGRLLEAVQRSVFLSYLFNNNVLFRFIS